MRVAGIDIGSRFIKFVVLEDDKLMVEKRLDTGYHPKQTCEELLAEFAPEHFTVTGYGRQLFDDGHNDIITEIKAVAIGTHNFLPECRTIIDIGGQDTKAISLSATGRVVNFDMNDRCAAGTGRFLEVMAKNLGFSLEELGALQIQAEVEINSLCTVFAESEVISLIARGVAREKIGTAVQSLIANRVAALVKRHDVQDTIVFTGGCAFNQYLKSCLEDALAKDIVTLPQSPLLAAYGAAFNAQRS